MLNRITIMGRLTGDPVMRYTQSQTPVASFSLAVERDFGNRDTGDREVDFINCVAWRNTADFVTKYFKKGSMAARANAATMTKSEPSRVILLMLQPHRLRHSRLPQPIWGHHSRNCPTMVTFHSK